MNHGTKQQPGGPHHGGGMQMILVWNGWVPLSCREKWVRFALERRETDTLEKRSTIANYATGGVYTPLSASLWCLDRWMLSVGVSPSHNFFVMAGKSAFRVGDFVFSGEEPIGWRSSVAVDHDVIQKLGFHACRTLSI